MKYGVHKAVTLAAIAALAGAALPAEAAPAPGLELRRVLLSSGGVGYFEYETTVHGPEDLSLSVRRDQVDDVLKSLVVYDDAGNLGEVTLPGKELTSEAFRDLPFDESALQSPAALLSALRGARVRVESAGSVVEGRIVSVTEEQVQQKEGPTITQHRLTLLADGALHQVVVEAIASLKVLDEGLQKQIDAALDALALGRERERRDLAIHISGTGDRLVRVGYVVAAPLWKSTYRLTLPSSRDAKTALLTGLAVVENRSGEPWSDVDLTLVSGNPVTFQQAIYDTYYVDRPRVPVEVIGRVLPRPDEGGAPAATLEDQAVPSFAAMPGGWQFGAAKRVAHALPLAPVIPAASTEDATQVVFHLPEPVSLTTGQTALLPIVSRAFPTTRIDLYQPATEARHPLASVEITNDSDTDLPPGVVAVYEPAGNDREAAYAGDAQLSLVPSGKTRFLSFAVDLRVTVDRAESSDQTVTLATLSEGTLKITRTERRRTTYTLVGDAHEARTVVLEHPRIAGFELAPSTEYEVLEVTKDSYRLRREVPAGATVKLTVTAERPLVEAVNLTDLAKEQLGVYAASPDLPAPIRRALLGIADLRTTVSDKEVALAQRTAERAKIIEDQGRLRENLKAVPGGSDLAKRYLTRLTAQEERLTALDAEISVAESALATARAALAAAIRGLHG